MAKKAKAKRGYKKVNKTYVTKNGKLQFTTFKGNKTDILHSSTFLDNSYRKRAKMAFNKRLHSKLSHNDKLLLRGYAFRLAEESKSYRYNGR